VTQAAVCFHIKKTHKCSVGRAYSSWMLNLLVYYVTSWFFKD